MKSVKRVIINILATTGLAVVALAIIVRIFLPGYDLYFTSVAFQTFGANIVIHIGLQLTRKYESQFFAAEVFLDILYTTIVLVVFGTIFDWYGIVPIWMLIVMAALINLTALFLNMARIREEANTINKLLKQRDENKEGAVK